MTTWSDAARRRGAFAAASLLVLLELGGAEHALLRAYCCVTLVGADSLLLDFFRGSLGLAVLWLLGPGVLRQIVGQRASFGAMAVAPLLGTLAAAAFTAFAWMQPLAASCSPGGDESLVSLWLSILVSWVLSGPLVEEWLFRGVLWESVRRLTGSWLTVCITAAAFTVAHGLERYREYPLLFAMGVLLGVVRHRSRSLAPCVLLHSWCNFCIVVVGPVLFGVPGTS